jgi:hypothetical protein
VLDAAGGKPDRVRYRATPGVAVGDHDEPAETEEIGASVRVGVKLGAQRSSGRADQQAAKLPPRRRGDLFAKRVE